MLESRNLEPSPNRPCQFLTQFSYLLIPCFTKAKTNATTFHRFITSLICFRLVKYHIILKSNSQRNPIKENIFLKSAILFSLNQFIYDHHLFSFFVGLSIIGQTLFGSERGIAQQQEQHGRDQAQFFFQTRPFFISAVKSQTIQGMSCHFCFVFDLPVNLFMYLGFLGSSDFLLYSGLLI